MTAKKGPWYKQYPANFIEGVAGMPAETIGVYSVLLNLMYARGHKLETQSRRDDTAGLARVCGVSTRQFGRVLQDLIKLGKITMDDAGRLSNPKFERMMDCEESRHFDTPNDPQIEQQQELKLEKPGLDPKSAENIPKEQTGGTFSDFSSSKNSPKDDEKTCFLHATMNENIDLASKNTVPAPARARYRGQIVSKNCAAGGSGGTPWDAPPEHMQESDFSKWLDVCARTIPRGWSRIKALKRWRTLPPTPWQDLADAWRLYIEDNREKSKGAKFKQRTMYPENWFRDRIYESYLDVVAVNREREHNTQAAQQARTERRAETITRWNGKAVALIAKIGERKFDLFVDTVLTVHPDGTHEIDFGKNDPARSEASQMHCDTLDALFKKHRCTSDRTRKSDAAFKARTVAKT